MRQHLFIDAADTLWEYTVYFERAIDDFLDFLNHSTLSRGEMQAMLDEIEAANSRQHGDGSASFAQLLDHFCWSRSDRPVLRLLVRGGSHQVRRCAWLMA